MGGVPVKHHSKGKVGRRRSHLALKKIRLVVCKKCKSPVKMHSTCAHCGTYSTSPKKASSSDKSSGSS